MPSLYAPLKVSLVWLVGTFVGFLTLGKSDEVDDMTTLIVFLASTWLLFTAGYATKAKLLKQNTVERPRTHAFPPAEVASAKRWIIVGGLFYLASGVASLASYGLLSPSALLASILSPGTSYFSRLRAAEDMASAGATNFQAQILTLFAVLSTPVVAFLVLYWGARLGATVRVIAFIGLGAYATYWLAIGTLKGLGDIVVLAAASALILAKGAWPQPRRKLSRRQVRAASLLGIVFASYMVVNQGLRLSAGDIETEHANSVISSLIGENAARGLGVTLAYPTHGYLGLSKNLETPFEWTYFRGSSRVVDSYIEQYMGSASMYDATYPARTEQRTGYPALMLWATIYPSLASDFTFPGAALLMLLLGWWLARFWFEAAFQRRRLSALLFSQLCLIIAYIPANNQIGLMRPGLIAFLSLVTAYACWSLHLRVAARLRPRHVLHHYSSTG